MELYSLFNEIFMNQHNYVQGLITLASLEETNSVNTPLEVNVKYRKAEGDLLSDPTLYWKLVGSLIYLTITQSNISCAVHTVSQFMNSSRHHLAVVHRVIHYMRSSHTYKLFFPTGSSLQLTAYSDADWAGCPNTYRSTRS